ncbi:RNA pyrophosphohydrolase [Jannaschia sp. Os4]|uniref:RNA pyrophosphohydrolase n=1 Tax=Jannaschia sp. Os4 TaxID=2807617 RepID=UPI00193ADCC2|nr:RNA pyrophosphohydrolase [Jannaschia sp. Os4]MBM2575880.1 RNA pyrophosphohydrolase [Jannaschia sp. Os4]
MTPDQIAALPYRPCVGICLTNPDGRVWTGQRLDRMGQAPAWQMPQGGIDPGEAVMDAAYRELHEETGLARGAVAFVAQLPEPVPYDLPAELVPKLWKGRYRGQMQDWVRLSYDGPDAAVDLDAHEREFSEWRWSEPRAVLDGIVPFKRDVYAAVLGGFGLL